MNGNEYRRTAEKIGHCRADVITEAERLLLAMVEADDYEDASPCHGCGCPFLIGHDENRTTAAARDYLVCRGLIGGET